MKLNIGVLFGGQSAEHEVAIISALQTIHAINTEKFDTTPIYITKTGDWYTGDSLYDVEEYVNTNNLLKKLTPVIPFGVNGQLLLNRKEPKLFGNNLVASIDIAFPVFHGTNGEDGAIQGLLTLYNIPYVGSDIKSSSIGMDKILFKHILKSNNILTTDFCDFSHKDFLDDPKLIIQKIETELTYPVIVKPNNLGSSIGISKATNKKSLIDSIENARQYSHRIIVEQMVSNLMEINCSVLGDRDSAITSELEEPLSSGDILDFKDKYQNENNAKGMESTERVFPAKLENSIKEKITFLALKTFKILDASGVSRIDFLVDKKTGNIYVNEVNTIPGSLAFYLWEGSNVSFTELTNKLIDLAQKSHRDNTNLVVTFDSNILSLRGKGSKGVKRK